MTAIAEKDLIRIVKDFETRCMEKAMHAHLRDNRLLQRLRKQFFTGVLEFEVSLKELNGVPKFMTFTFKHPKASAFIFFTYGPDGKRYFNRKVFDRMWEFLEADYLTSDFARLLREEQFEEACTD